MTCFLDQSDIEPWWKRIGFCLEDWCDIHYFLISCNLFTLLSPQLVYIYNPTSAFIFPSLHSAYCDSFLSCLCYLKKENTSEKNGHVITYKAAAAAPWSHFSFNWMQIFSECSSWVERGTVLSVILFLFVVSPCQS